MSNDFSAYVANVYSENSTKLNYGIEIAHAGLVARGATKAEIRAALLSSPYAALEFDGVDLRNLFTLF